MSRVGVSAATLLSMLAAGAPSSEVKHLPNEVWASIKDTSSFQLRASVSVIPDSVRTAFAKARGEESFAMAEPGAEWQATDVTEKTGLPRRRLKTVALSHEFCILFYELGGRGRSHHVVIFRLSNDGATLVWRAVCDPAVTDPAAVLMGVDRDTIDDDPKYGF